MYMEIKDSNPQGYLVQWEMIKKILEQHSNAAGIGAFELGHAYGRIKEVVQALSTNTILPPSHVWRKVTDVFNTSF
jgi:hypothetical protein